MSRNGCHNCAHLSAYEVAERYMAFEGTREMALHRCLWAGAMPQWVRMDFIEPGDVSTGHRNRHIPVDRQWPEDAVRISGDDCLTFEARA